MSCNSMTLRPVPPAGRPASLAWNAGAASLWLLFDFDFAATLGSAQVPEGFGRPIWTVLSLFPSVVNYLVVAVGFLSVCVLFVSPS